ncbi:MAG: phosphate ABC transporter permease subunit PstC [Dehalococcoidia bacterium]|nr:MAG: phosphate ABC transporter permease subunit PstC [Dehalococcoidia bacterium]
MLVGGLHLADRLFKGVTGFAAVFVVLIVGGLFYQLIWRAWPAITANGFSFIWSTDWNPSQGIFGAGAFLVGTALTSVAALILATAVAVLVALYLVEVAPSRVSRPVSYMVELLAAIPSVVYGLWGIYVLGGFIQSTLGPMLTHTLGLFIPFFDGTPRVTGLLSAIVVLTIMIIPTVMAVSRDVIAAVPGSQREAILALGATRWETIRIAVLPYARSGILGGAILGLARAVGETLAVTLVIGNRVSIPHTIFDPTYTMASVIANQFQEAEGATHRAALMEVALLLLCVTFLINVVARLLVWRVTKGQRSVVIE